MPMPELPSAPPRPVEGLPPLRSVDRYALPVRQKVILPPGTVERVSAVAASLLQTGGFTLVRLPSTTSAEDGDSQTAGHAVFAERSAQRVATHISMLATVGVLIGAGIGLGGVDALVLGNVIYALPWVAVGIAGAGILWWRYGRGYESELVAMHITSPAPETRTPADGSGVIAGGEAEWSAGRVRSVLFAGTRTVVGVGDCPISLMRTLGALARRFEAELTPAAKVRASSLPP